MILIIKNKRVDFSMNPLYKHSLHNFQIQQDDAIGYLEEYLHGSGTGFDGQIKLRYLNLSDTYLGIDLFNLKVFLAQIAVFVNVIPNSIEEIDISCNHLKTIDCDVISSETSENEVEKMFYPKENPFKMIIKNSESKTLKLNFSNNELVYSDVLLLLQNSKANPSNVQLALDFSNNNINKAEMNGHSIRMFSRTLVLEGYLFLLYKHIISTK